MKFIKETIKTISSREVVKLMEVQHKNLIAKREKHTEILEKLLSSILS